MLIQTDTTTGCEYRRPEMQKLWRYAEKVPKKLSGQVESLSVYRASYKPTKINDLAVPMPKRTCHTCDKAKHCNKDLYRATVPIESLTTYNNHYKCQNFKCRKIISSAVQNCRSIAAPKAHNYD
uniref:Uncharacterized protein n=1 Tax=Sipha flava TaxID=143950 RepID=A0A2S2QAM6_9HEMI